MKIEHIETIRADRWLIVVIATDSGLVGVGEGGLWAFPDAAATVIDALREGLLGQDPLRIEHHWQSAYRSSHFRGAALGAALSAIDIALWDIAGKHFGAPIHALFGGRVRDRVRLYMHVNGRTVDELVASAQVAVADGFTAVRFDPFRETWPTLRHSRMMREAVARVGAVRDAVGPDVDICIECHFKLHVGEAPTFGRLLADFDVLFVEDPIIPESPRAVGEMAVMMSVPVATGERLQTIQEYRDLLSMGAVAYIRPDICLAGGFTQTRKIAALAESAGVGVIPHNWLSPICTAACVQLDAAIPNFTVQEATDETQPPKSQVLRGGLRLHRGHIEVPDGPGLGVEVDLDYLRTLGVVRPPLSSPRRNDGSVADH